MAPEKIYVFLIENLVSWSRVTLLTLVKPINRFELTELEVKSNIIVHLNYSTERKYWLSPKLISYSIFSIILGLTINELIPNRKSGPDLITSIITIFLFWLLSSSFLHLICKILKGKGKYLETVSVHLQVLSTVYVFTSIFTLVVIAPLSVIHKFQVLEDSNLMILWLVENPSYIFYIVSLILLLIYVPLAQRSVHKLNWIKTVIVAFVPILTTFVALLIFVATGIMVGGGS